MSGEVVEGAVDDIRRVFYAMAIQKHPEPESGVRRESLSYMQGCEWSLA